MGNPFSAELGSENAQLGNLELGADGTIFVVSSYPSLILHDNALAYYRLDEQNLGNLAVMSDFTSNAHNGRYGGGSASTSVGSSMPCIDSNPAVQWGTNDFAIVRDSDGNYSSNGTLNIQTGSWEAWFKPLSYPSVGNDSVILANGTGGGNQGYFLDIDSSGSILGGVRVAGAYYFPTASNAPLNVWTYACVTYDGSIVRLYVNGVQVGTVSISGTIENTFTQLVLGSSAFSPGTQQNFVGQEDEVAIYNVVLTADQILAHFQVGTCTFPTSARLRTMIGVGL